jgi:SAM-dependent methyltransferase
MTGIAGHPEQGDAFGAALLDRLAGGTGAHVIERDDGFVDTMDAEYYFAEPAAWDSIDTEALTLVSGRILDVGAGAGRHSLALQDEGHAVVALDISAGAIEVSLRRGVTHTFLGTPGELAATDQRFDAAIMMGNGLGLLGSRAVAPSVLDALRVLVKPGGIVVGTMRDPHSTEDPDHLAFHEHNRSLGRLSGEVVIRTRFRALADPWFEWLHASPEELATITTASHWDVVEYTAPNPAFLAVLRAR